MTTLIGFILIGGGVGAVFGFLRKRSAGTRLLAAHCGSGALYGAAIGAAFYFLTDVGGSVAMNQSTANVTRITEAEFDAEVIHSEKPVVVDFYASWCAPCKILSPRLDTLAGSFTNQIKFVKVNVDEAPDLVQRLGIEGYPTLLFFKNGKPAERILGLLETADLKARLASFAGTDSSISDSR